MPKMMWIKGSAGDVFRRSDRIVEAQDFINYYLTGIWAASVATYAGVMLTVAQPTLAAGFELDSIAATVIGGTAMSGGKGGVAGTFAGVLIVMRRVHTPPPFRVTSGRYKGCGKRDIYLTKTTYPAGPLARLQGGVVVFAIITNLFNLIGLPSYYQQILRGSLLSRPFC
jgi:ribose/xylose/arabinose/galactoside ABC-type transport system permease subunit